MVNAIQLRRQQIIEEIVATLKKAKEQEIYEAINNNKLLVEIQTRHYVARRTALEYISVARSIIENGKE